MSLTCGVSALSRPCSGWCAEFCVLQRTSEHAAQATPEPVAVRDRHAAVLACTQHQSLILMLLPGHRCVGGCALNSGTARTSLRSARAGFCPLDPVDGHSSCAPPVTCAPLPSSTPVSFLKRYAWFLQTEMHLRGVCAACDSGNVGSSSEDCSKETNAVGQRLWLSAPPFLPLPPPLPVPTYCPTNQQTDFMVAKCRTVKLSALVHYPSDRPRKPLCQHPWRSAPPLPPFSSSGSCTWC